MGKSVSVTLGKGSLNHNNRVFNTDNVDPSLTINNVVLKRQRLNDAYQEIFGEALERYNQKQKRNDRQIPDYLEHIKHSKNGEKAFHEIIVQVGDRYDTGIKTADAELAKEILIQYYSEFFDRNPNMKVFNAVIHMDEKDGTPHLHIDFVPVALGQKRGLEIRNSMRQALQQQGFDFQQTQNLNNPDIMATYKQTSKIGGGRWLDAERETLGAILKQHGIERDNRGVKRDHMTVKEFKACAEIIGKEIEQTSSLELEMREPSLPMKIAGVKEEEVIVRRSSVDAIRKENSKLRAQAEINHTVIRKMDKEKESGVEFVQRVLREAGNKEKQARLTSQEADSLKTQYSYGTAAKYNELANKYNKLVALCQKLRIRNNTVEQEKKKLEESIPGKIKNAIDAATSALHEENSRLVIMISELKNEIDRWKQIASVLQEKVTRVCHVLHDVIRAVFTLKYDWRDKRLNPYKSNLTAKANCLVDALELETRAALHAAGHADLEKGLDGMGVSVEIERNIHNQTRMHKPNSYVIGK